MYRFGSLIAGQWRAGEGGEFTTFNPARPTEAVGSYTSASQAQIRRAVEGALKAQRVWRNATAVERSSALERFIAGVEQRADELAKSITLEQGKPLSESRAEVAKSCAEARFMAGEALRGHSELMPAARPGMRNMVIRRPRGVIAAITPWNFPILTPMRKLAPAVVFGNAVILKPSELTPSTACMLGEIAGGTLPEGLVQVINGAGEVGSQLVSAAGIAGITFTGSVATGRAIFASAAQNLAEISLELGGKNAVIVNDTHDLEGCLDQIVTAACMCAGQRCTAISRVIVRQELHTPVVEGLAKRFKAATLGDGMDSATTIGPLINARQLDRVSGLVAGGIQEGAEAVTGGAIAHVPGLEAGYFFKPTVLSNVGSKMKVAREEIFGPVISILRYANPDEAFGILNGVDYGLTSALFSDNNDVIQRFIDESENGMIHVNHGTIPDNHMPFGGVKNSGVGAYSVGPSVVGFYTTEHAVYVKRT